MNGDKRYHGEIKVSIAGSEARINIFSDNLQQLFADLGIVQSQYGIADPATNPAKRAITNAEEIARRQKAEALARQWDKEIKGETGEIPLGPTCVNCGTSEYMELIQFKDKKTGEPRQAWKCQQCQEWNWPNGKNGRGR